MVPSCRRRQSALPPIRQGRCLDHYPLMDFYCRHVKNLRLHNLDLTYAEKDQRPAVVCDDVIDLDIFGLRAQVDSTSDAVIRCRNVQGAMIHGSRPQESVEAYVRIEGPLSRSIAVANNDLRNAARAVICTDGAPKDEIFLDHAWEKMEP